MSHFLRYRTEHPLVRVGQANDGGYVIADVPVAYDGLLSGGVSDDISFENQVLASLKHVASENCYAFDATLARLPHGADERITFVPHHLGAGEAERNLATYLAPLQNALVKLDIEGSEFVVLPQIREHLHKVAQLVVEIHTPADIRLHPAYYAAVAQFTDDARVPALMKLVMRTHTLVHVHPNNGPGTHLVAGGGVAVS